MYIGEFPWEPVLPLLSRNRTICRGILGSVVATQGSGPYSESDFNAFLEECGIEVRRISGDEPPAVVVLGREDWNLQDVRELPDETAVYSQEMVIASMAIGTDIFELLESPSISEFEESFVFDHPAMECHYIGFPPDDAQFYRPLAPPDDTGIETLRVVFGAGTRRPPLGVLRDMGYRAGQSGLLPYQRREVLRRVLFVKLVANSPWTEEYIREWGEPGTYGRLGKTTRVLASLARIARRKKTADMSEAIDDWESDLAWLNETYGH